ncbi:hypothetical protein A6V36_18045 [Paraburkholderia ginsengiterrae]|uniref:Porin domain-containing protein n=1 Tax=Paraburkholderia ginsengiterrae TaxID=1462993 RepID=A0A1A9MW13_9BURK|nr:porin [Paraburkholderia ginsengiterrae]OAJ52035.1 hypothetical protein A6V37_10225 [Paraburkholderia ginsengiterrae]OAJ63396.1 hypothetical protein A6V36_18045 [Paraburkholderia ginsengiterrae]
MKCKLLSLLVMSTYCVGAAAQSSVTLYGVVDEAVAYANNAGGAHVVQMIDSFHWNTAFGIKGTEDLGGGLKALFDLTSYFNLSNGKQFRSDSFFSGGSWVGLSQIDYGTVTVGRHFDYSVYLLGNTPAYNATFFFTPANADHMAGGYIDNAITYRSPTYHGFTFSAMYALPGGSTDLFNRGRVVSFSITYADDRLRAATVATKINGTNFTPTLAGMKSFLGQQVAPFRSYAVDAQNIYGASTSYRVTDRLTGQLSYTYVAFEGFGHYESIRGATVSAVYAFQPDLKLTAGYGRYGIGSGAESNYSLFLDKFLSKRTDAYVAASLASASGATQSAALYPLTPSSTSRQVAIAVGVRHFF